MNIERRMKNKHPIPDIFSRSHAPGVETMHRFISNPEPESLSGESVKDYKIHIVSLGCSKNLVDSEVMASILIRGGSDITSDPEYADIIVINTCAFILPAKEESIDEIFRMAEWKKRGKCKWLVVTGCLPQRYGSILAREIPEVDLFLGTSEIPKIADFINNLKDMESADGKTFIGEPSFLMDSTYPRLIDTSTGSAYLKIAEGCSNCCSYCVIPHIRGHFRSRDMNDVLTEAEMLAKAGIKEIIITAQDTSSYGIDLRGKPDLSTLLREMTSISGIRWIRVLYTYPAYLSEKILRTISDEEKICNYIDIPLQHIDDGILKAMNRKGGSVLIRKKITEIRDIIPSVTLRTSFIVGFPGETSEEFDNLLNFVRETGFENLGVFPYSREEGTAAAGFSSHVSEKEKKRRRDVLMKEQSVISREINRCRVGEIHEVLIEKKSNLSGFPLAGRIRAQAPDVDGITYVGASNVQPGDIITCRIISADVYDLFALQVDNAV